MFVDYSGQPVAAYYFLKRTYEPTHVILNLPELMWGKGEKVPLALSVINNRNEALPGVTASVQVFDTGFHSLFRAEKKIDVKAGLGVTASNLGLFTIPDALEDHFFLMVAELRDANHQLISRSVYWPRCVKAMADEAFRTKYRTSPQPPLTFENGPWLKNEVQANPTKLELNVVSVHDAGENESVIQAPCATPERSRLLYRGEHRRDEADILRIRQWLLAGARRRTSLEHPCVVARPGDSVQSGVDAGSVECFAPAGDS